MTDEDKVKRMTAERERAAALDQIDKIDEQIKRLERRRAEQEKIAEKAALTAKGIDPCTVCNRHVPSPCNGWESFHQDGPWDTFCREYLEQERRA